ncbi:MULTISPECIES: stage II sporulation protein M [unclassified Candidatus Frackibacter]|uniref:stage II sporulation protein M n=1 Tax=unclassified Candidatus Frackibacter TaxID=2648818 RepID=UPI0007937E29|nr:MULTISPECIES: stage II sporulation protein M [unclassified Candidatus Frackibacter]KXS41944.1 MAG: stage II sporulation protein M [Candidatus Frackibacter sp. T328-2]SDC02079.1 stage II sporulation protein M [Candidatus Frackibacter sp. WG11]SEM33284.1 stage II sporulation protein M [Candidatus Frackibacter sp. WG12]SFL38299.1 stage II sporulation protein M [Candidatus Frackibacter sp. WG13]
MFNLKRIGDSSLQFIQRNFHIFLFLTIIFISGVIFGSIAVKMLSYNEKGELINYLSSFFQGFKDELILQKGILAQQAILYNLKMIIILWVLGVSVIGMPLIPVIVFLRGFVIGFTASFLIDELAMKGLVFAAASILPHNLLVIPVLLLSSVAGIAFSFNLFKSRFLNLPINFVQYFFGYSTLMVLLAIVSIGAGLIESFLTPTLMGVVTKLIING